MTGYSAKRLPVHRGPAAWNSILGEQSPNVKLDSGGNADCVIIGGGFAGLSAARRLKQLEPSSKIVLMEASRIAEGASGRNSGFMIDLPHELSSSDYAGEGDDKTLIGLNRQAIAFGREAVEEYDIDQNFFDEAGKINGAASDYAHNHNLTYSKHLEALGEASEMLDAQKMHEITGSTHYMSGLYTPGTVMLQPAGYIRGLADGLQRNGVEIYEQSAVSNFRKEGDDWRIVAGSNHVTTPRIILANNGHLESFGIAKGRLMQIFLFASMTPELDNDALKKLGGNSRWGITPSDPMGTTMRRIDTGQGGNRIITRTCAVLRQDMESKDSDLKRSAIVHRQKFDQRFPQLAGMEMEYQWAGHLCLSLNGSAVTGEIDKDVFSACVQNGLGTTRGTLTGIAAAELAAGKISVITHYFAQEAEPKELPPKPFAEIGANAYMRFKEWRARDE